MRAGITLKRLSLSKTSSHWKTLTKVQDDEYDLFNPEFDSTDGEPCKKYVPNSRFFENPNGSLESEGEIDTPQLTSADSDSDSDSDLSDDDDDDDEPQNLYGLKDAVVVIIRLDG